MKKIILLEVICFLLALLFLYTSVSKLVSFGQFVYDMHNQVFPHWVVDYLLVPGVPSVEILISISLYMTRKRKIQLSRTRSLTVPVMRLAGLYFSLVLMLLFTLYTALVLFHTFPRVPCSCGGVIKHLSWTQHVFFNLFFVALSVLGIWLYKRSDTHSISAPFASA